MADDPIRSQLADTAIAAELRVWRRAHAVATLTEIEQVLDAHLDAARAGLLAEVAADVPDDAERCPGCGERLVRRGKRTRPLRTAGDAPLEVTRADLRCPACGAGLSPLDERLGLLAGRPLTPALAESVVRLGASVPFADAAALLAHFTGVRVGAETVRRLTEAAGASQVAVETAAVAEV